MRRAATFALAAVLGGGVGMIAGQWSPAADQAQNAKAEQKAEPQLPNGTVMKNLDQIQNIRDEFATITNDALTHGDFGKVVDNLGVVNRDRMKDYKNQDFAVLDGVVAQIHKDWKQKYGHDFDIKGTEDVFGHRLTIVQGVVTEANVAAANLPVPAEAGQQARLASGKERGHAEQGQAEQVKAKDLQDSKGVALARFPGEWNLPEITASMIQEGHGSWRIAVPDNMSSQQLHTQLQNHLTYFDQDKAEWPANEAEAYRQVTHHVLMALYDVNAPEAQKTR